MSDFDLDDESPAHTSDGQARPNDDTYSIAAGELRQFIEQFEQLESEKKDVAERQKELMAEAKARGYDTKVMKKLIALRKRDKDDIAEEAAILDMYMAALGMEIVGGALMSDTLARLAESGLSYVSIDMARGIHVTAWNRLNRKTIVTRADTLEAALEDALRQTGETHLASQPEPPKTVIPDAMFEDLLG